MPDDIRPRPLGRLRDGEVKRALLFFRSGYDTLSIAKQLTLILRRQIAESEVYNSLAEHRGQVTGTDLRRAG